MFYVLGFRPIHTAAKPWHMAAMNCVVRSSFSGAWYQVVRHVKYTRVQLEGEREGRGREERGKGEEGRGREERGRGEGKRREGEERE